MRRCKQCKEEIPAEAKSETVFHKKKFCSFDCMGKWGYEHRAAGRKKKEQFERKAHREAKERVKTRQEWIRDAQRWFNKFIRIRDASEPCISCGRHHQGQYHAGHYRTTAAAPQLRFDESNCHKQCSPCNLHLSGNIANYRPALIEKIGLELVESIESDNVVKKWTIEELKEIKATYKTKCKELDNGRS